MVNSVKNNDFAYSAGCETVSEGRASSFELSFCSRTWGSHLLETCVSKPLGGFRCSQCMKIFQQLWCLSCWSQMHRSAYESVS